MIRHLRLILALLSLWIIWYGMVSTAEADGPDSSSFEAKLPRQLVIPSIDLDSTIVEIGLRPIVIDGQEYMIWNTADSEVGWHQGSGPLGRAGNTVLAGHSNGGSEVFRHLEDVDIGEDIFVASDDGWYHYQVSQRLILRELNQPVEIRAANAQWILPTEDERLTLITCWPYPLNTHRLLVIAFPASPGPLPALPIEILPKPSQTKVATSSRQKEANLMPLAGTILSPTTRLARAHRLNDLLNN